MPAYSVVRNNDSQEVVPKNVVVSHMKQRKVENGTRPTNVIGVSQRMNVLPKMSQ